MAPWLASYLARLEDEDEDAPPEAPRAPPPAEAAPASKPSAAARAPPPETARSLELDAEATTALAQLPEREVLCSTSRAQLRDERMQEPVRRWQVQPNAGLFAEYHGEQVWSVNDRVRDLYREYV